MKSRSLLFNICQSCAFNNIVVYFYLRSRALCILTKAIQIIIFNPCIQYIFHKFKYIEIIHLCSYPYFQNIIIRICNITVYRLSLFISTQINFTQFHLSRSMRYWVIEMEYENNYYWRSVAFTLHNIIVHRCQSLATYINRKLQ